MRKYDCYQEHDHQEQGDVGSCDHHYIESLLAALAQDQREVERLRAVANRAAVDIQAHLVAQHGSTMAEATTVQLVETLHELRDALTRAQS